MSQVTWDEMTESPGALTPTSNHGEPPPSEQPPKLKGRRRLLQSLQKMSSSPSLAKMGRAPSTNYAGGGKGSMSCVSLASSSSRLGHSYNQSYSSVQSSTGFSTAPTSLANTPGPESQSFDPNVRIRILDGEFAGHAPQKSVPLPADMRPVSKDAVTSVSGVGGALEDYFSKPTVCVKHVRKRKDFSFWSEMPQELAMHVFQFLRPRELVKCSVVSKAWHKMCFDGQLWKSLDVEEYYTKIPAMSLIKLMTRAGPFVRELNLRGCRQMPESWGKDGQNITDACRNLEYVNLRDCNIDRSSVHCFLVRNPRLVHINLSCMKGVNNSALRIIAQGCQQLEYLDISWCQHVDTRGLLRVVQSCEKLRDLRACEVRGFDDKTILLELFKRNTLERLMLSHCVTLDDECLEILLHGVDPEIDPLTERPIVPPRKLLHLDISRCTALTDVGVKCLAYNIPYLCGLQLSFCEELTDDALTDLFASTLSLTHLDLEEVDRLSNVSLQNLAKSPCAPNLRHLNISFCENLGDSGMLPLLKACPRLCSLFLDNTRISNLALIEAATQVHQRDRLVSFSNQALPKIGLNMVIYDCQNVTWTGIRGVLCRNTEPNRHEIISLKCFYGYQDTVDEHMKRVLRGDAKAAACLENKWVAYMVANEEAGVQGAGGRRRRRRLRDAAMVHADEEEGGPRAGRRRARSGGSSCAVM